MKCDQSLIKVTSFDHDSSVYLLQNFAPMWDAFSLYSRDKYTRLFSIRHLKRWRPPILDALQCLGFLLAWHRKSESMFTLNLLFGVAELVCDLFIRIGKRIQTKVFSTERFAAKRIPTMSEFEKNKSIVPEMYPSPSHVCGVADWLKQYLEESSDFLVQKMFYNDWKSNHYVVFVMFFVPSGCIAAVMLNKAGCMPNFRLRNGVNYM